MSPAAVTEERRERSVLVTDQVVKQRKRSLGVKLGQTRPNQTKPDQTEAGAVRKLLVSFSRRWLRIKYFLFKFSL